MTSFQEFDDSSATRCANNDSLEKQKNDDDMTSSSNTTITLTSIDGKNTSSDEKIEKIHKQNDKTLNGK
jgi:hypothetical protein